MTDAASAGGRSGDAQARRVGVLGSMVWDRIDHPDGERVERWGGIAYSLAAAAAALPADWVIRPIIKLGCDLAADARAFLEAVPGLELPGGVVEVDSPSNRVHLRYRDRHERQEVLTGGVPAWRWQELAEQLAGLDALYVNLISGFELDLESAQRLRGSVDGPVYGDLHSLILDRDPDGVRVPRRLERPHAWLAAFDIVQANEAELRLVAGPRDPEEMARDAIRGGVGAVLVTRGPAGATWYAGSGRARPWERPAESSAVSVRTGRVPVAEPRSTGDPTGCGDVWGATCFMALLTGEELEGAMRAANRAASRNVSHRGADGLHTHLRTYT